MNAITRPAPKLLLWGIVGLMAGCGSGGDGPAEGSCESAWRHFRSGDYARAVTAFRDVLSSDTSQVCAYAGLGWSFACGHDLDSAEQYFELAIGRDPGSVDARAGLGAVLLARHDLSGAIAQTTAALVLDSVWEFDHLAGADHLDLHLILAEAYLGRGESFFSSAQSEVDYLDPNNGLRPDDSGTWGTYPSYAAALLRAIQDIEERIGAEMMLAVDS